MPEDNVTENPEREIVLEQLARVGQALANPRRLRLLGLLGHADRPVEELAALTGQSHAATSGQLQGLRRARLVRSRRRGRQIWYGLRGAEVGALLAALQQLGFALVPEVREVVRALEHEPHTLREVDHQELLRQVEEGEVILVDLRPAEEYATAHVPGARSVPFEELEARLATLPPGARIVAYCRGPLCLMAREGVRRMRARGLDVDHLPADIPDWRARGLPLERA